MHKEGSPFTWDYKGLANFIVDRSKSLAVTSRIILVSNNKLEKKAEKLKLANRSNTSKFAQLLLHIRRQNKHRGIQLSRPGDKDWLDIKEVCNIATEFSNEMGIKLEEGYKEFITIGLTMMKHYSIYKFKSITNAIYSRYEATQEIGQDKTPDKTLEAHNTYLALISERTGFSQGYRDVPEKYQYFKKAKEEAIRMGVTIKTYIKSQFSAFEFKQSIPDPAQLVGHKAIERLQRYCFEHGIEMGNKKVVVNFETIKKNGKGNNHTS